MSGIVGIFHRDGRGVDRAELERMTRSLAHRGPDGSGSWCDRNVGLGHRMLRSTPESVREVLPVIDDAGDIAVTADARIDNRAELFAALDLDPSDGTGDARLILASYRKWGDRCPERLLGDFAFVVWDTRRQSLFCARDHFGIKPFHYHLGGGTFRFGSEIKALFTVPDVPRRLNEQRVADYLLSSLDDTVGTFYRDVLRLPPAHSLEVTRDGSTLRRYWALDPERDVHCGSDGEYAEAFREIFAAAVRARLRSTFPVGAMLSGGLDSSSIACTARAALEAEGRLPMQVFSVVFDDVPQCDERPFINAVLAQGGFEPHFIHGDQIGPFADLERVLWHEDEAVFTPNLFLHWAMYRAAQDAGTRVLLDGFDGDIVVSHGLPHLAELVGSGRWIALAREVSGLSRRFARPPWGILARHAIAPWVPERVSRLRQRFHIGGGTTGGVDDFVSREFARRAGLAERRRTLERGRSRILRSTRRAHHHALTAGLLPFALEVADRAAAAFAVEPRYPFFDRRLVEFCLALPAEQKIRRGWTRLVMRHAMAGVLPERIRWRGGKSNLAPNFVHGLLTFHRGRIEKVVRGDHEAIREYVDQKALGDAYRRCAADGTDGDAMAVWKSVSLAVWLQQTRLVAANH